MIRLSICDAMLKSNHILSMIDNVVNSIMNAPHYCQRIDCRTCQNLEIWLAVARCVYECDCISMYIHKWYMYAYNCYRMNNSWKFETLKTQKAVWFVGHKRINLPVMNHGNGKSPFFHGKGYIVGMMCKNIYICTWVKLFGWLHMVWRVYLGVSPFALTVGGEKVSGKSTGP